MISPRRLTFRVPSFSSNPPSRYFTASSAILLQAGGELCCHLGIKIDADQLVHFLHGKLCEDNNRLDVFISRINTIRPVASHLLTVLIVAFTGGGGGGGGGSGGFSVSRYSSYSRDGDRERERYHHSDRDSDRYSSSRYSTVTSPTSSRRTTSNYSSSSSYSRFLPSSRWTPHHYSDEEPEEERDHVRDRDGRRVQRGETKTTTEGEV